MLQSNPIHQLAGALAVGEFAERHQQAQQLAEVEARKKFVDEYLRRMNAPPFATLRTAGELLNHVLAKGLYLYESGQIDQPFVLDRNNLDVYQQLASYFSDDYATFACDLNPRKGILLFGGYGCGKSVAMRLFVSNPLRSYRLVSARTITEAYRLNGDVCDYKHRFGNLCSGKFFGQSEIGLCIDDLGAERSDSKSFGSGFSMGDLLQDRYDNPQLRGWTHVATNATPAELRKAYGPRVYDRLRQMFNVVEFPEQPSRRI